MSEPVVDWEDVLLWSSATLDEEADLYLWASGIAKAAERWQASHLEALDASEQHDAHVRVWRTMGSATRDAAE